MNWNSLITTQNLKLAWRRLNTSQNVQYKRFFREAYLVFESSLEGNIRHLHDCLEAQAWSPHHANRVYLPKPSGLQRPISLLDIEDQILLQAFANKVAKRLTKKRKSVELDSVFSNQLGATGSIFFTERWDKTYPKFQQRCEKAYRDGYRWSAQFDLAAYYDTISHDLLLSIAGITEEEQNTFVRLKEWLRFWSANDVAAMTGHGIPQGPMASDFLAEAFFLPIDIRMQKSSVIYLRYVDDIRLFARTEADVREAAINLEQECRHRGLIPQSSKFALKELRSASEALGSLPSIPPVAGLSSSSTTLSETQALAMLKGCVSGRPKKVLDKSRFRYVMYRAPASSKILTLACRLLSRHPEHIDVFISYFGRYEKSTRIVNATFDYLASGVPYSYVRGELWQLLARLSDRSALQRALPLARQDARKRHNCVAHSWGVMRYLLKCQEEKLSQIGKRLQKENPISRALLAPLLPSTEFAPNSIVTDLLRGRLCEQFAGARELQRRKIKLNALGLRQRNLPDSCKRALLALGIVKRRHILSNRDWIALDLRKLYGCNNLEIWRRMLGTEYEHALQILIEAKNRFLIDYSGWLNQQDSFNDAVIRKFFEFLRVRGLPGHSALVGGDGKLVNYGSLLQPAGPFATQYPAVANALRTIHDRRNLLPSSHPYDKNSGLQNQYLKGPEQRILVSNVRSSLNSLALVVDGIP